MANTAHSHQASPNAAVGPFKFASGTKTLFAACAAIGVVAFIAALKVDAARAWPNYLVNFFYFMSISAITSLFIATQHISNSFWSITARRLGEGVVGFLPVALGLALILFLGRDHLYLWTGGHSVGNHSPEEMEHLSHLLTLKAPYLNSSFFAIRLFGFMAVWTWLTFKMRGNSISQDASGDHKFTLSNIKLSSGYIPLFGITFTLLTFDLLMSLEPSWFSTIFGVYCFGGAFSAMFSMFALLMLYGRKHGIYNNSTVNENHLHDIGKMMFTFVVFWAYTMFSQEMLQWYANQPEEITYFIRRFHGAWWTYSILLFLAHFVVPFLALASRLRKRNETWLRNIAILLLVAHWMDCYYMVMPVFRAEGPAIGWIELGTFLGFFGIFGMVISKSLEKAAALPIKDPRLGRYLAHNQ